MKIGILTFHWATNYGAILQTFALQTYLINRGHDVFIINYRPKQYIKKLLGCFLTPRFWHYLSNLKDYIKEKKLEKFRKEYLNETILYESLNELKSNSPKFDVYVSGSDQVWNPHFTTRGEGKPTSAYFLDFGDKNIKRIAYAVSFGCEVYPDTAANIARNYIPNFNAISVRENSGIDIVSKLGFSNPINLSDPTLLLVRDEYCFANSDQVAAQKKAFVYILREEYKYVKDIKSYLKQYFKIDSTNKLFNPYSVEKWVNGIKNASIVLTNSFHGMVFSLIFNVPFIVIPAKDIGAGMNDRFITILSYLNLEHRIMNNYDSDKLHLLIEEKINWQKVNIRLKDLQKESDTFFYHVLS